jgi:prolyl oligopeptidase
MFLVSRKGMVLDGNLPVLLTGYGGFNSSSTPAFASQAAYWVGLGGVYAVANLRGAASLVKPGTAQACLKRNRMCSTILFPPPNG